jgi:hypothetical protein
MCSATEDDLAETTDKKRIEHVDGNRYDIRDVEALDGVSRAWLLRYI